MSSLAHMPFSASLPTGSSPAASPLKTGKTRALTREIAIFDVLGHETMHLQFNEAYIRLIHQAFPDHRVVFHARTAHLTSLSARLTGLDRIDMRACPAFTVPFGLSPTKGFHLFRGHSQQISGAGSAIRGDRHVGAGDGSARIFRASSACGARRPARADYLKQLAGVDMVCLPYRAAPTIL